MDAFFNFKDLKAIARGEMTPLNNMDIKMEPIKESTEKIEDLRKIINQQSKRIKELEVELKSLKSKKIGFRCQMPSCKSYVVTKKAHMEHMRRKHSVKSLK